jgi:hypothetical protein
LEWPRQSRKQNKLSHRTNFGFTYFEQQHHKKKPRGLGAPKPPGSISFLKPLADWSYFEQPQFSQQQSSQVQSPPTQHAHPGAHVPQSQVVVAAGEASVGQQFPELQHGEAVAGSLLKLATNFAARSAFSKPHTVSHKQSLQTHTSPEQQSHPASHAAQQASGVF